METKKVRNVLLLVIMSVISWVVMSKITTMGLSNPTTFYDMEWGIDKAMIALIITLMSITPAAGVIIIVHLRKKFRPAQW